VHDLLRGVVSLVVLSFGVAAAVIVGVHLLVGNDLPLRQRVVLGVGLSVLLLGRNAASAASFAVRGLGRMAAAEVPLVAGPATQFAAIVVAWTIGIDSATGVSALYGAAGAVVTVVSVMILRSVVRVVPRLFRPAVGPAVRLVRSAAPFALSAAAVQVVAQIDVIMLGLIRSSEVLGGYEPALRLTDRVFLLVPALFLAGFIPAATRLLARERLSAFRDLYVASSKLALVLCFPLALLMVSAPDAVLRLAYGERFPASADIVWILAIGYVCNLAFGLNTGALVAAGDRGRLMLVYGAVLVFAVVSASVLVPIFGATGAALSTTASYVVLNLAVGSALFVSTRANPLRRDMVVVVVSAAALLVLAATLAPSDPPVALTALICTGCWVVWSGVLLLTGQLRLAEVREFVPRADRVEGA
jgi:O-antigen/teichoic acid export membrane protein